jgi:hypothetical protein
MTAPSYHDGHLVVAAVRILENREKHPPTEAEIGALLQWHPERVGLVTRGLVEMGVLKPVTTAYDMRLELADHLPLETLTADEESGGFADELAEFDRKSLEQQQKLEKLFDPGEMEKEKQKRAQSLDEEFKKFRKGKPNNPFGS